MDLKLSKDVPGMFKSFLERILSFFQIWWKSEKSGFLAIFEKNDGATKNHKLRSRRRKNILRSFFERLRSTFSISNFIFVFWCLFVTQTVHFGLDASVFFLSLGNVFESLEKIKNSFFGPQLGPVTGKIDFFFLQKNVNVTDAGL